MSSRYRIATLPYADRRRVLEAVEEAVAALHLPTVNDSLEGGCQVCVSVNCPPERLGTHTPEPEKP